MQTIEEAFALGNEKKTSQLQEAEKEYERKYVNAQSRLEKIQKLIERPSAVKTPGRYQKLQKRSEKLREEIRALASIKGAITDHLESLQRS